MNLLSNAFKFTPEGGRISVSMLQTGSVEGGLGLYELRVKDSGIGMSKAFAERMFNAFERERTSTVSGVEGTGLGLAITKRIVDLMGGTIEVITSPGSGTEMIIRLKLRPAAEADVLGAASEAAGMPAAADFTGRQLLLVEDNDVNREIARLLLEQAGFGVEVAENGQIAVDLVAAAAPGHYDAVLMDIQMPVMDGYEATRRIRALDDPRLSGIPIIAMTANAFREDELAARDAGMQAHIAKPLDAEGMMRTIAEVLNTAGRAQMRVAGEEEA